MRSATNGTKNLYMYLHYLDEICQRPVTSNCLLYERTGMAHLLILLVVIPRNVLSSTVQGGQRSIIFSRIGGIQPDVYREGLHFRCLVVLTLYELQFLQA